MTSATQQTAVFQQPFINPAGIPASAGPHPCFSALGPADPAGPAGHAAGAPEPKNNLRHGWKKTGHLENPWRLEIIGFQMQLIVADGRPFGPLLFFFARPGNWERTFLQISRQIKRHLNLLVFFTQDIFFENKCLFGFLFLVRLRPH